FLYQANRCDRQPIFRLLYSKNRLRSRLLENSALDQRSPSEVLDLSCCMWFLLLPLGVSPTKENLQMRQTSIAGIMCLAIVLLTTHARGQSPTGTGGSTKSNSGKTNVSARLEIMERALEAQQQQIRSLENELKGRDAQLQQLQQQITQTQAAVKEAVQTAVQESQSVAAKSAPVEQLDQVKRDVDDLKGNATSMAFNLQETQ